MARVRPNGGAPTRAAAARAIAPGQVRRPAPAPLQVVKAHERAADPRFRTVAVLGATFMLIAFATLFVLAMLHALHVQTQVEIDTVRSENAELESRLSRRLVERAELDSLEGLIEAASGRGLVEATEVVMLVPLSPGLQAPPVEVDPFAAGAGG